MKKKYTLQLVNYQIKTYYHKAFQLLKHNHSLYTSNNSIFYNHYKKTILKHFIQAINNEKTLLLRKGEIYALFTRIIQLKNWYTLLRLQLLNKRQAKRLRCIFLSNQLKLYYQQFTHNALILSNRTNLYTQYNIFFVKRMYITFFKSVCKYISYKAKRIKAYNDANEIYSFKLTIKAIRILKDNVLHTQSHKAIRLRKRIIMRIFYKNLKEVYSAYKQRCFYYRQLHLKKYYFNRLSRISKALANNRIAKLKFISKWLMLWKEAVLRHKRSRAESIVLLIKSLDKIKYKFIIKSLKTFYIKFKDKNRSILKAQINEIKCTQFISKHNTILTVNVYKELKYNMLLNKFTKRKQFLMKRAIFQILKFIKDTSIPMYIKDEEAVNHYKKTLYRKWLKPYVLSLRKSNNVSKGKMQFFRVTMLKIRIFKLLKTFRVKSIKENYRREIRFRRYFLLYNYMNMMKKHSLIMYRENKILTGIKRKIAKDRLRYIRWGYRSLRNNLIVKRCKRRKMYKLIIQVFTAMRMMNSMSRSVMSNMCLNMQNGYRSDDGDADCDENEL